MSALRLGVVWGGMPSFAYKQAPPRFGRGQVHLVRVEVDWRGVPPQPDREAREVRDHCAIIHTHAMIYDIMCAVRTQ